MPVKIVGTSDQINKSNSERINSLKPLSPGQKNKKKTYSILFVKSPKNGKLKEEPTNCLLLQLSFLLTIPKQTTIGFCKKYISTDKPPSIRRAFLWLDPHAFRHVCKYFRKVSHGVFHFLGRVLLSRCNGIVDHFGRFTHILTVNK